MGEVKEAKPAATEARAPEGENGAANAAPAAPARKSPMQFVLAGLLLLGLALGSASAAVVVASYVMKPQAPQQAEEPAKEENVEKKPTEFAMPEALIVNVHQTQQRRYLSVKPVFVLDSEKTAEVIKGKLVEVQHILIGILKTRNLEQLDEPDAANVLGREIQETVNLKLNLSNGVTSVYFTQFVVQ